MGLKDLVTGSAIACCRTSYTQHNERVRCRRRNAGESTSIRERLESVWWRRPQWWGNRQAEILSSELFSIFAGNLYTTSPPFVPFRFSYGRPKTSKLSWIYISTVKTWILFGGMMILFARILMIRIRLTVLFLGIEFAAADSENWVHNATYNARAGHGDAEGKDGEGSEQSVRRVGRWRGTQEAHGRRRTGEAQFDCRRRTGPCACATRQQRRAQEGARDVEWSKGWRWLFTRILKKIIFIETMCFCNRLGFFVSPMLLLDLINSRDV